MSAGIGVCGAPPPPCPVHEQGSCLGLAGNDLLPLQPLEPMEKPDRRFRSSPCILAADPGPSYPTVFFVIPKQGREQGLLVPLNYPPAVCMWLPTCFRPKGRLTAECKQGVR